MSRDGPNIGSVGLNDRMGGRVLLRDAVELTVGEVMISRPKTLSSDASVREVRRAFELPSQRTELLVDGERFVGAIEREGLPVDAGDDEPAGRYVESRPLTVTPEMLMADAVELLERRGEPRLIVLDPDGATLRGLLCATGDKTGFCVR
jgi:CBS domain-containing protein